MLRAITSAFLLLLSLAAVAQSAALSGNAITLRDSSGIVHHPFAVGGDKAVVLIFIANDCPISNSYAPEINQIMAAYAPQRIVFYLVNVDNDVSAAAVQQHAGAYGYRCPVLLDADHLLVKHVGVTVTPEAAVYSPKGQLLYRGRIDDKYVDFGKVRYAAKTHDLRDVLKAILTGRPVSAHTTKAIGCAI